jgi:hypothetical protein
MCEHRCLKSQNRFLRDALACAQWVLIEQAPMRLAAGSIRPCSAQRFWAKHPELGTSRISPRDCCLIWLMSSSSGFDARITRSVRFSDPGHSGVRAIRISACLLARTPNRGLCCIDSLCADCLVVDRSEALLDSAGHPGLPRGNPRREPPPRKRLHWKR